MVQIVACLVRSLDVVSLRDDVVTIIANFGGSGCVLLSCVTNMCMLYARVCCMSVALEVIPQRSDQHQFLLQLLARVRETLSDAAKVACCSAALACGCKEVFRGIVASVHLALHEAQLPAQICEYRANDFVWSLTFFWQLMLPPQLLRLHLFEFPNNHHFS